MGRNKILNLIIACILQLYAALNGLVNAVFICYSSLPNIWTPPYFQSNHYLSSCRCSALKGNKIKHVFNHEVFWRNQYNHINGRPSPAVDYLPAQGVHWLPTKFSSCSVNLNMATLLAQHTSRWYSVSHQLLASISLVTHSAALTIVMQLIKILHLFTINNIFYKPQKKNSRCQVWRTRGSSSSYPMIRKHCVQKGINMTGEEKCCII
jgi:hypothetical protein